MSSWSFTITTLKQVNSKGYEERINTDDEGENDSTVNKTDLPRIQYLHPARCWAEIAMTWPLIVRTRSCTTCNFLAMVWRYTHAPILTFPVCVLSRLRSRAHLYLSFLNACLYMWKSVFWYYPALKIRKNIESEVFSFFLAPIHSAIWINTWL